MGITEILTITFVLAKIFNLGGIGEWSWWQVFIPEYIAIGFWVVLWIIAFIVSSFKD